MVARAQITAAKAVIVIEIEDRIDTALRAIRSKIRKFSNSIGSVGLDLFRGGLATTIPTGFLIKQATEFEDQMLFLATKVQATDTQFASLEFTIRRLGETTSFTAVEVAQAATELAKASFSPREIEQSLQATLDLARGAQIELSEASSILANTMKTFDRPMEEAGKVTSEFIAAARMGTLDVIDLKESLKEMSGTLRSLNVDLPTALALLDTLSFSSIKATKGGTSLNTAVLNLGQNLHKLQKIGIDFKLAQSLDLVDVLDQIKQRIAFLPDLERIAFLQDIFNIRGGRAVTGIILRDMDLLRQRVIEIRGATDEARLAAVKMDSELGGSWRMATSALEEVGITIQEKVSKPLQAVLDTVPGIARSFNTLADRNERLVQIAVLLPPAILAAGIAAISLSWALGKVASMMSPLMGLNSLIGTLLYKALWADIVLVLQLTKHFKTLGKIVPKIKLPKLGLPGVGAAGGLFSAKNLTGIHSWSLWATRLGRHISDGFEHAKISIAPTLDLDSLSREFGYWAKSSRTTSQLGTALSTSLRSGKGLPNYFDAVFGAVPRLGTTAFSGPFEKEMLRVAGTIQRVMGLLGGPGQKRIGTTAFTNLGPAAIKNLTGFTRALSQTSGQSIKFRGNLEQLLRILMRYYTALHQARIATTAFVGPLEVAQKRIGTTAFQNLGGPAVKNITGFTRALTTANEGLVVNALAVRPVTRELTKFQGIWGATFHPAEAAKANVFIRFLSALGKSRFGTTFINGLLSISRLKPSVGLAKLVTGFKSFSLLASGIGIQVLTRLGQGFGYVLQGAFNLSKVFALSVWRNTPAMFFKLLSAIKLISVAFVRSISAVVRFTFSLGGLLNILLFIFTFGDKIPFIKRGLDSLGEGFKGAFAAIGDIGRLSANPFGQIIQGFKDIFAGAGDLGALRIKAGLSDIATIIRSQLSVAWNRFVQSIAPAVDFVRKLYNSIVALGKYMGGALLTVLGSVGDGFGSMLRSAFSSSTGATGESIAAYFKENFNLQNIIEQNALLANLVAKAVLEFVRKIIQAISSFAQIFNSIGVALLNALSSTIILLSEVLSGISKSVALYDVDAARRIQQVAIQGAILGQNLRIGATELELSADLIQKNLLEAENSIDARIRKLDDTFASFLTEMKNIFAIDTGSDAKKREDEATAAAKGAAKPKDLIGATSELLESLGHLGSGVIENFIRRNQTWKSFGDLLQPEFSWLRDMFRSTKGKGVEGKPGVGMIGGPLGFIGGIGALAVIGAKVGLDLIKKERKKIEGKAAVRRTLGLAVAANVGSREETRRNIIKNLNESAESKQVDLLGKIEEHTGELSDRATPFVFQ